LEAVYISEVFTFPSQTAQFHKIDNYWCENRRRGKEKGLCLNNRKCMLDIRETDILQEVLGDKKKKNDENEF